MRFQTFQAFLFPLLLISFLCQSQDCPEIGLNKLSDAKTEQEIEKLSSPYCLSQTLESMKREKFASLAKWKKTYGILKTAQRLPRDWALINQSLPFLMNKRQPLEDYNKSWAFMRTMRENHEDLQAFQSFWEGQPKLKEQVQKVDRSAVALDFMKSFF